jgi:hypothetical protein
LYQKPIIDTFTIALSLFLGRLWRFLFLLKLWASATGLFSPEAKSEHKPKKKKGTIEDEAEQSEEKQQSHHQQQKGSNPKSHWNSYTLSLCAIAYLQSQQQSRVIPPIGQLIRPNSRKINGWAVEYDLPFFRLEQEIPSLLRVSVNKKRYFHSNFYVFRASSPFCTSKSKRIVCFACERAKCWRPKSSRRSTRTKCQSGVSRPLMCRIRWNFPTMWAPMSAKKVWADCDGKSCNKN